MSLEADLGYYQTRLPYRFPFFVVVWMLVLFVIHLLADARLSFVVLPYTISFVFGALLPFVTYFVCVEAKLLLIVMEIP